MLGALTITKYRLMKDDDGKIDATPFLHRPIPNHSRIRNRTKTCIDKNRIQD
jgi:hypothetical protein